MSLVLISFIYSSSSISSSTGIIFDNIEENVYKTLAQLGCQLSLLVSVI